MALERSGGSRPEDTVLTKIFVGGLAWETRRDGLRAHFEKFGEVNDAIVVADGITGRSRGYGFVTFKDAEAARKACEDPFPVIDGRRTNCNLASLGAKKNHPYTPSPHPDWEKRRRRSGPSSRINPGFNRFALPSPHTPRPGTWDSCTYPTYRCPAYSYSVQTMVSSLVHPLFSLKKKGHEKLFPEVASHLTELLQCIRGTTSSNLSSPAVLDLLSAQSTLWPTLPGHNTLLEIRTLPSTLHTVLVNFDSRAAIAGHDSGAEPRRRRTRCNNIKGN